MAAFNWTEKILKNMKITAMILVIVVIFAMYFMMIIMNKQTHSLQDMTRNQGATVNNNSYSSASEFSWRTISRTLSIYSSYYDRRHIETDTGVFKRSLMIFGYGFGLLTEKLFCVIIMNDNARVLIDLPADRVEISELWRHKKDAYRGFGYRCKLTTPEMPRYVTLTNATTTFKNIAFTSFISVADSYIPAATHKFGVCYGSPLHGFKYDQDIMDSIEMNKLLGATWFTMYVYEANDKAMKILKHYSDKLKILNAVLNWRENLPSPVYNRGQLVSHHDCIYRNMYQVQFLALCDLDELILPQKGLNWNLLFSEIDRPERAHFVFAHLGFHRNETKPSKYFNCPSKPKNITYKMPRFFAMYKRSVSPLPIPRQAKSIVKPKFVITARIHYQKRLLPGYHVYYVPKNVAVMKHFRDKTSIYDKHANTTSDHSMDRFKDALLGTIEKQVCNNIDW